MMGEQEHCISDPREQESHIGEKEKSKRPITVGAAPLCHDMNFKVACNRVPIFM